MITKFDPDNPPVVPLEELTDVDEQTNRLLEKLEDLHCPYTEADNVCLEKVVLDEIDERAADADLSAWVGTLGIPVDQKRVLDDTGDVLAHPTDQPLKPSELLEAGRNQDALETASRILVQGADDIGERDPWISEGLRDIADLLMGRPRDSSLSAPESSVSLVQTAQPRPTSTVRRSWTLSVLQAAAIILVTVAAVSFAILWLMKRAEVNEIRGDGYGQLYYEFSRPPYYLRDVFQPPLIVLSGDPTATLSVQSSYDPNTWYDLNPEDESLVIPGVCEYVRRIETDTQYVGSANWQPWSTFLVEVYRSWEDDREIFDGTIEFRNGDKRALINIAEGKEVWGEE